MSSQAQLHNDSDRELTSEPRWALLLCLIARGHGYTLKEMQSALGAMWRELDR